MYYYKVLSIATLEPSSVTGLNMSTGSYIHVSNIPFSSGIATSIRSYSSYVASIPRKMVNTAHQAFFETRGKKVWTAISITGLGLATAAIDNSIPYLSQMLTLGHYSMFAASLSMLTTTLVGTIPWATMYTANFIDRLLKISDVPPPPVDSRQLPHVTIQIPTYNEPFKVVRDTSIRSALALDYPRNKLLIQVVDNSNSPEKYREMAEYFEELKDQGYNVEFIHRDGRDGGKARNLNISLGLADINGTRIPPKGDVFFLVDCDIEFPPDILRKTAPEFVHNPKLPFAIFEVEDKADDNLFNIPAGIINQARSHNVKAIEDNGLTTMGGYGTIYRRSALASIEFDGVRGWQENFVGEDWATGILLRTNPDWESGKRISYVKVVDRSPDNLHKLKTQQKRWAKGTVQTVRDIMLPKFMPAQHIPWNVKADAAIRFSFYPFFVFQSVIQPLTFALAGLSSPSHEDFEMIKPIVEIWAASFPLMLFSISYDSTKMIKEGKISKGIANMFLSISGMLNNSAIGLHVMKGLYEGIRGTNNTFQVTPKEKSNINENQNIFSRYIQGVSQTLKVNSQEIMFGLFLSSSASQVDFPYSLAYWVGLGYLFAPFAHLITVPKFSVSKKDPIQLDINPTNHEPAQLFNAQSFASD